MPHAVHRRLGIGADLGDDFLDLPVVSGAGIVIWPRPAVASQQQDLMIGAALRHLSQLVREFGCDRNAEVFQLLFGAIAVATFAGARHPQGWQHRMVAQILDAQPGA